MWVSRWEALVVSQTRGFHFPQPPNCLRLLADRRIGPAQFTAKLRSARLLVWGDVQGVDWLVCWLLGCLVGGFFGAFCQGMLGL